jgi:rhomboid protease GluP
VPLLLVVGYLVWELLDGGTPVILFLLAPLAMAMFSAMAAVARRPEIVLAGGRLSVRCGNTAVSTAASNVANVWMEGGEVRIVFHDIATVLPDGSTGPYRKTIQARGAHLVQAPRVYTLAQVNQLRTVLGLIAQEADVVRDRLTAFDRQLREATPRTIVTHGLITVNLLTFAAMMASTYPESTPSLKTLIQWGANYGPQTLAGQWWRLFTCQFLHAGVPHLFFNLWVLRDLGRLVERFTGNFAFLLLYLFAGTVGSIASLYTHPEVTSVGASGAIFGLLGATLAFVVRCRGLVPHEVLKGLWASGSAFVVFNLAFGVMIPGIDVAAHVGGLVGGFLGGFVVSLPLAEDRSMVRWARHAALVGCGMLAVVLVLRFPPATPPDVEGLFSRLTEVERTVFRSYNDLIQRAKTGDIGDEEFLRRLDSEVLAPWIAAEDGMKALGKFPRRQAVTIDRLQAYMQQRRESWEALRRAVKKNDPAAMDEHLRKWRKAETLVLPAKSREY